MTQFEEMIAEAARIRSGIPPGKFRLVTFDTFNFPAEACVVAESEDLEALKRIASSHTGEFDDAAVYDSTGACVYSPRRPKK